MDFDLTEEQTLLRDSLGAYLDEHYAFDRRQTALRTGAGWRPDIWQAFARELGILGATLPEAHGGLGGGAVEAMIIMEAFGKSLVVEPFVSTVIIAGGLLARTDPAGASDLIEGIIDGRHIFAFAQAEHGSRYSLSSVETAAARDGAGWRLNGRKLMVLGAPHASHLIVTARTAGGPRDQSGISLFVLDRNLPGITLRDYVTIDGFRAANIDFRDVSIGSDALLGPADGALPLIEQAVDEAIIATCAEACGTLRVLLDSTVDYTRTRKQFGAPISSFQALQHRMADMFIHVEQALSMTYMATLKAHLDHERTAAASAAKVQIGKACRFVGQSAIQLHGAIGMTDEMATSHYFKRATTIEALFGSVDHHLARVEALQDRAASR